MGIILLVENFVQCSQRGCFSLQNNISHTKTTYIIYYDVFLFLHVSKSIICCSYSYFNIIEKKVRYFRALNGICTTNILVNILLILDYWWENITYVIYELKILCFIWKFTVGATMTFYLYTRIHYSTFLESSLLFTFLFRIL